MITNMVLCNIINGISALKIAIGLSRSYLLNVMFTFVSD